MFTLNCSELSLFFLITRPAVKRQIVSAIEFIIKICRLGENFTLREYSIFLSLSYHNLKTKFHETDAVDHNVDKTAVVTFFQTYY